MTRRSDCELKSKHVKQSYTPYRLSAYSLLQLARILFAPSFFLIIAVE